LIDDNDQSLIKESITANGIYQRLIVIADEKKDHYLIIDGCNRFDKGVAVGQVVFDCELVECEDVRKFITDNLISRRKGTVSQRVLAYLECNKAKVMQAAENYGGRVKNLKTGSQAKTSENTNVSPKTTNVGFGEFTVTAIAHKFGCNESEITAGIELLKAIDKNHESTDTQAQSVRIAVLQGNMGLRGWKSADPGKNAEQKGKADANYARLAGAAITTVCKAFQNWGKIKWNVKDKRQTEEWASDRAMEMFKAMPEGLYQANIMAISETWKPHHKQALIKALKAK
jgi:hydrogenase maturation factor HypF (carbamoyltransferase family)